MAGFVKYLSIFVFTILFSIGLITFTYNIEMANHSRENILGQDGLTGLNSSLSGLSNSLLIIFTE